MNVSMASYDGANDFNIIAPAGTTSPRTAWR